MRDKYIRERVYKEAFLDFLLLILLIMSVNQSAMSTPIILQIQKAVNEVNFSPSGSIIRVPEDYPTIQEAIDAAAPRDIVFVRNGIYNEDIRIYKPILLIGESRENTVIIGSGVGDVIDVSSDGVKISGFTVKGSGAKYISPFEGGDAGIKLNGVTNCSLSNIVITKNSIGIFLNSSSNNIIENNEVYLNSMDGIYLRLSNGNVIRGNNCTLNGGHGGIYLNPSSNNNLIENNVCNSNLDHGIKLQSNSNNNVVKNNTCLYNNNVGIFLLNVYHNKIVKNNCSFNGQPGIFLRLSEDNLIANNTCSFNRESGIQLDFVNYNNTVKDGVLTIMLTDPPKLPPDVTAVYITYDGFSLHIAGAGGESGWVPVPNVKGTIELTGLVNVSQTIASVPIEKGKYNQIRFNVTRALVTYNGKNYTAIVRTEMLTIKIEEGGIIVNASKPAYTLIDVQPTVFNLGNASNPFFVITAAAKAVPVPPEELKEEREEARRAGYVMKLKGKEWWENIRKKFESSRISIVSASLSKDSLNVEVKNVGNEIVYLKLLIVSPILYNIIPKEVLEHKLNMIVPHFLGAEVFIITEDGKPVPVKVKEIHEVKGESSRVQAEEEMGELFGGRGYALKPGESVKLSYTGTIAFNFTHKKEKMPIPIFQGEYLITVVGENAVASKIVNMSQ